MAKNRGTGGVNAPAATNQSETVDPVVASEEVEPAEHTEMAEDPIEEVDPVEPTETVVEPEEPIEAAELPALIERYRKAYPSNKIFYLTSDNQVFLADARSFALLHQRSLKGGQVQTFEV